VSSWWVCVSQVLGPCVAVGGVVGAAGSTSNMVSNPSGEGGSTAGWTGNPGELAAVQQNGQWWLEVTANRPGPGWDYYQFPQLPDGTPIACAAKVMGSGTVYLSIWNGSTQLNSQQVALSSTPVVLTASGTIDQHPGWTPPQHGALRRPS